MIVNVGGGTMEKNQKELLEELVLNETDGTVTISGALFKHLETQGNPDDLLLKLVKEKLENKYGRC